MLSPVFNYYDGYANKHMVWGYSEWFTSCWSYDYQPSISLMVWKFIPKGEKFTVNIAHPREVTKETIEVQTGEGILILTSVQPEGKKRMPVKDFLLGYPVKPGEYFGA